ncbi:MAG: hypothetical protein JRI32_02295 [Deltaproteobacteria bacterium]|nr:hypothetical protein [Deltaproteobacteria bacterium]MBW2010497.1 hypothetical protein [Deltaproteobacteria bacterium]
MIKLGIYRTTAGKCYDCHFIREKKVAQAVGPLPEPGNIGGQGVTIEVNADSKEEAREKIAEAIGPGHF